MKRLCKEFAGVPLLANMVEGGKTPLFTARELQEMGYKIVIYPGAAARVIAKAVTGLMEEIMAKGTTKEYLDHMFIFGELNEILELKAIREQEKKYAY